MAPRVLVPIPEPSPVQSTPSGTPKEFTYNDLKQATHYFAKGNFLGEGSFGCVYKGVLQDGRQAVIRVLKRGNERHGQKEYLAEVEIIGCTHHRNLVQLIGYCISKPDRLLVYQFIRNESLSIHLHDYNNRHGNERPVLDWQKRFNIALGTAKGLAYLQEGDDNRKIIHHDIKSTNILLDENFEAKVADFGVYRFFRRDDTHVSTGVKGTSGYSDVYTFGMLLLELITGRKPIYGVLQQVKPALTTALTNGIFDFADPKLHDYDASQMYKMVACAAWCLRDSGKDQPLMIQIPDALEGKLEMDFLNNGDKTVTSRENSSSGSSLGPAQHQPEIFTYKELKKAANDFAEDKLLGKGGFGIVYKGDLGDGRIVAIKQQLRQWQLAEQEFLKEIETVKGVRHEHLVHLVGHCISKNQRLLVYEFVPNKSLHFHLHENDKEILDWKKRFNIAVGTAKGLVHLHDSSGKRRIVHGDIKSENILLDERWMAKVADFGLARSILADKTHVSTIPKGTFGYTDPDLWRCVVKLNDKSDVHCFGMLLLELITGCEPLKKIKPSDPDDEVLAVKAKPMLTKAVKDSIDVVYTDPKLGEFHESEMFRMVHCAAACICYQARDRPPMSQILDALLGKLDVKILTERIKTMFNEEDTPLNRKKLLEMLKAISEEDSAASSIG